MQPKDTTDFFVRLPEALRIAGGVHRNTLYRWIEEKRFPPFYRLSERVVVWKQSELDQWVAEFKEEAS